MENTEFDKILYTRKHESDRFFAGTDYTTAREKVHKRVKGGQAQKAKPVWPAALKAGFIGALMITAAAVMLLVVFSVQGADNSAQGVALSSQPVSLSGENDYVLDYFSVSAPRHSEPSLMSVLWELNQRKSEMVYSTVFEKCDETYPASTIAFPDSRNLVLIFSGNSRNDFLDYRLIGFSGDTIKVWWSQDYVKGGTLDVNGGVITESRVIELQTLTSHIVPYDIGSAGKIVLPARSLEIRVGEFILLVGSEAQTLDVRSENGLIERTEEGDRFFGQWAAPAYRAKTAGEDTLQLKADGNTGGYLSVSVTE